MHSKTSIILAATIGLGLTACATHRMDVAWPEPRPLGKDFTTYRPPHQPPAAASPPLRLREPIGVITLRQVLPLALMKNPELVTFSWEVRAREARTLQTALLPNPELSTVVEDVGGSGAFSGLSQAETTIALSQLIELGGKRSKRTRVASLTRDLAGWDYETKRIELLTQVSQAFIDVLGAQERLVRTEELVRLAEQVALTTSERVKAGKVSPVEETRANAAFSLARIELDRAERALEASRKRLAATWGSTSPHFERVEGELDFVSPIPFLDQLAQRLTQNPELARWGVEISQRQAVVDFEKSKAIPDVIVTGGYRWFSATDDYAFVFDVSAPLPFFNRNQGGIMEAHYRLAKAEGERQTAEVRTASALAEAYKALSTAYAEVTALKANVLPAVQSAFEAINEGYRFGKFSYLDVLDAQRTLFDSRLQYLQALTDYHKAVVDVERLIGEPLAGVQPILHE